MAFSSGRSELLLRLPPEGRSPLRARTRWARAWRFAPELAMLLVVAVVGPVAVAVHYGSLGAAGSDDWAYDLAAFHLANQGGFDLFHWGANSLVGQLVLSVPVVWLFGDSITALNVWTCLVGMAGLGALVCLGHQLGLSRRGSLFGAATIGLGPMWAVLSTTFMSDIPAVSFMLMALAVAGSDRATDRLVTRRSLLALLLGFAAFTIRDAAVVVLPAIAWGRLWRCGRPRRRPALAWAAAVALVAAVIVGFYEWRQALPSGGQLYPGTAPLSAWWYSQWMFPLWGLALAPVAVFIHPLHMVRTAWRTCRSWTIVAWMVMPIGPVVLATLLAVADRPTPNSVGAIIDRLVPTFGNGAFYLAGPAGPILPDVVLLVLGTASAACLTVVSATVALGAHNWLRRPRRQPPVQAHFVAVTVTLALVGAVAVNAETIHRGLLMWDRYLLPCTALSALVMMYVASCHPAPPRRPAMTRSWALGCLGAVAAITLVVTVSSDAFVGNEWSYSRHLTAELPASKNTQFFTYWSWSAYQHRQFAFDPSHAEWTVWWIQDINQPRRPGQFDYVTQGSWVQHYTFAMSTNPQQHSPDC